MEKEKRKEQVKDIERWKGARGKKRKGNMGRVKKRKGMKKGDNWRAKSMKSNIMWKRRRERQVWKKLTDGREKGVERGRGIWEGKRRGRE